MKDNICISKPSTALWSEIVFNKLNKNGKQKIKIMPACLSYLNPWLCQSNSHGKLLSHKDVGIMSFGKTALQFVQLRWREPTHRHSHLFFGKILWVRTLVLALFCVFFACHFCPPRPGDAAGQDWSDLLKITKTWIILLLWKSFAMLGI